MQAEILDRMLGAYTVFEYRNGECFRRQASAAYRAVMGQEELSAEEFEKRSIMEDICEEDWPLLRRALADCEMHPGPCRLRHILPKRGLNWLDVEFFLLKKEEDGALYCGILRDATEQTRSSQELETSREALLGALHISEDDMDSYLELPEGNQTEAISRLGTIQPICMIGGYCEEGFPLYFAIRELYRMMGYGSYQEFEPAIQGKVANTIYYEDLERVSRDLGDDYHVGMEYTTTYRMPRKDGGLLWVLDKGRVVESGDHRLAILSYCMDITEIMERQLDLQRSVTNLEQQNWELQYLNNTIPKKRRQYCRLFFAWHIYRARSSQKATALAAATFRESTPWDMGMRTV